MSKLLSSLQTKLTVSFVILVGTVSALAFFFTFREAKRGLLEVTQAELRAIAAVVAHELSGEPAEAMAALKSGEESSDAFKTMGARLDGIRRSHSDIKYLYTMKKSGDDLVFMVDPDFADEQDPGASIGEAYDETSDMMLAGFERPTADEEFSEDKWGTLLSGYAPLRDTAGAVVGIVGVDMLSDLVVERQEFIGTTIYAIVAAGVLVAGLFVLIFSRTIIRDIRSLNRIATEISMGNKNVQMNVERTDEIGELAESFGRMVASLKIMMPDTDGAPGGEEPRP